MLAAAVVSVLFGVASPAEPIPAHTEHWQAGDIVFLNGTSLRSRAVRLLQGYSTDYSHVGIVTIDRGVVSVVHADPHAGKVVRQPWDVIASGGEYSGGAIYRATTFDRDVTRTVCAAATRWAEDEMPFDSDFDLATADRQYCTELVWRAYQNAGIELRSGTKDAPGYLLPDRLLDSPNLQQVARF